jgi:hypothetical protein
MKGCFASDLDELAESTLASFDSRVSGLPEELCVAFHEEARTLESQLLMIYKMVALCARREDDLDHIAELWGHMVSVCDRASEKLQNLLKAHPYCGADVYQDRMLDLRNRCHRLQETHA